MKKIVVRLPSRKHEVLIGSGILAQVGKELLKKETHKKAFLIADLKAKSLTQVLSAALRSAGWEVISLYVKASENLKSFDQVCPIYDRLIQNRADRHSVIFAIGGGVIGDTAGFIAGTYLRGIRWVSVPTTFLSQVDSALGGKTGINHRKGKNLIGVFHQPISILCDIDFLHTLPKRELISGLGEVIKYGLIFDRNFYLYLRKNRNEVMQLDPSVLTRVIHRCLLWKTKVVEKDELDRMGVREVLNFGHTLGHALEAESGYGYFRHGEAVILGMRVATHLSYLGGHLDQDSYVEVESFLASLPVPPIPKDLRTHRLIQRLSADKKNRAGKVRFILLKEIGKAIVDTRVKNSDIALAIEQIRDGKKK